MVRFLTKNLLKMNTKKMIFAIAATFVLLAASCTPNTTAEDDQLYEQGVDRTLITKDNRGK